MLPWLLKPIIACHCNSTHSSALSYMLTMKDVGSKAGIAVTTAMTPPNAFNFSVHVQVQVHSDNATQRSS